MKNVLFATEKNLQILNEKLVNESMERIKENTKEVLENV